MIHKETFFQAPYDGVPGHWVVQYWESEDAAFPEAEYFADAYSASKFEEQMTCVCSPLRDTLDDE